MLEFLRSTPAQAVVWVTVLIVLCVVAVYVVKWFRSRNDGGQPPPGEWLTEFREMSEQGGITPEEFRQIKSVLGTKLQHDLGSKDTEDDG